MKLRIHRLYFNYIVRYSQTLFIPPSLPQFYQQSMRSWSIFCVLLIFFHDHDAMALARVCVCVYFEIEWFETLFWKTIWLLFVWNWQAFDEILITAFTSKVERRFFDLYRGENQWKFQQPFNLSQFIGAEDLLVMSRL